MNSGLADTLATAEARGDDPFVAALSAVSEKSVLRAAWVLSTVLAVEAAVLVELLGELWPDDEHHEQALVELLDWPMVERTTDGYRLTDASVGAFRSSFAEADPVRFRRVHELLAALEEREELAAEPEEGWFIRGRVAYYLAGYDPDSAMQAFGKSFSTPPVMERSKARMWLSWLAVRQESLMPGSQREISFYRGFRAYVLGSRVEARREFDSVIGRGDADVYEAMASHFAGLLRRRDQPDEGISLLQESVRQSHELDLTENEIMARQSLVAALTARQATSDLGEANALAKLNLSEAVQTDDEYLIFWCRKSAALTRWLFLTDGGAHVTGAAHSAASEIVAELRSVAEDALYGDPETALLAENDAAIVWRDLGDYQEALNEITAAIGQASTVDVRIPTLVRLAKTTGSLLPAAPPALRPAIREALDWLNEAQKIRVGRRS